MSHAVAQLHSPTLNMASPVTPAERALQPARVSRSPVELCCGAGVDAVKVARKHPRPCQARARVQRTYRLWCCSYPFFGLQGLLNSCDLNSAPPFPHARVACHPPQVRGCAQALDTTAHARRYRVCDMHLAAERVVVDRSTVQRYCRTCTSFHPLEAFDGAKRTCARQLKAQAMRYRERKEGRVVTIAVNLPSPELPQLHAMSAQQPVTLIEDLDFIFHHWFAENTAAGYCAAVRQHKSLLARGG